MPLVDTLTIDAAGPAPRQARGRQAVPARLRVPAGRRPADGDRRARRGHRSPASATRCCSAPPAPARPSPPPRSSRRRSARRSSSRRTRPWPRSSTASSRASSPRTRSSTSSPTTTTTSPRPTSPRTDTYIEKESQINEQIDRMRHSATRALLERDDVIIVASVSCIYGIGSAETYGAMTQDLVAGHAYPQRQVIADLVDPAVPPQRQRLPARQLPRPRRLARDLAGAPRGPRLAALASSARSSNRSTSSTR